MCGNICFKSHCFETVCAHITDEIPGAAESMVYVAYSLGLYNLS